LVRAHDAVTSYRVAACHAPVPTERGTVDTGGCAQKCTRVNVGFSAGIGRSVLRPPPATRMPLWPPTAARPSLQARRPAAPLAISGRSGFLWNASWSRVYCQVVAIVQPSGGARKAGSARPQLEVAPFEWMGQGCGIDPPRHSQQNIAARLWRVAFHGDEEANIGTNFLPKMSQNYG
jgi:hypothetical protein